MKKFPDVDESKEEYKFETPKFQVEEVVQESPKEAGETQEESEETSEEGGSISEAPFITFQLLQGSCGSHWAPRGSVGRMMRTTHG